MSQRDRWREPVACCVENVDIDPTSTLDAVPEAVNLYHS
jgi:hypothetical protein